MHKVLIIDDEKDICFLISEILKDENFSTSIAINSDEAISKFNEIKPDLVILDVWLSNSKLDGIEILKNGIEKKIKGITFDGSPTPPCTIPFPVYSKNRFQIGNITSGIYSPFLKTNIGLSMVDRDYWNDEQDVIVLTPDNIERKGKVCSLPFNYS